MKAVPALLVGCLVAAFASPLLASPDQPVVETIEAMTSYADRGDPTAQFNLGISYTKGEGVARDFKKGLTYYEKAAQLGFAPAQYNLGVIYLNGTDLPRDEKKAAMWLKLAADRGLFEAQKILMELYIEGRGVAKNPVAALELDFKARRTLQLLHDQPTGEPPHPPVVRKDGAAVITLSDGKKRIFHPDGGEETAGPGDSRVITYKGGKVRTIFPDGKEVVRHPGGLEETKYPDGKRTERHPSGTLTTYYPDGRKDIEGTQQDKQKRNVRITENWGKDGKLVGRVIVRDNVTIRENSKGPFVVETLLTDQKGVKVKLTEEVRPDGNIGQRKLTRVDDGAEPKGTEIWTVRRELEQKDGSILIVDEDYYSLGLATQREVGVKATRPAFAAREPATRDVVMVADSGKMVQYTPEVTQAVRAFGGSAPVNVFKEKVNIAPMLKELDELEWKAIHFAGATEADWAKAKAAAAAYMLPLSSVPQKPGAWPSVFTTKLISGATFPVFPFTPTKDDFSKEFPIGVHGRAIIGSYPWKHAETPNFIVHYIEDADARLSMQFIEGAYSVIVNLLGLDPKRGNEKGHVFLFANEAMWQRYLVQSRNSNRLAGFAYKNELLLPAVNDREGREDSIHTLCHEVTHAIISRFYPGAKPPLWLNEGLAEYIAARTIAVKRGHMVDKYMSTGAERPMNVEQVFQRVRYGINEPQQAVPFSGPGGRGNNGADPVITFYANSAWCVRTMCEKLPPDGFPKFLNAISAGNSPDASFRAAYGAKCPDTKTFSGLVNSIEMPRPDKKKK